MFLEEKRRIEEQKFIENQTEKILDEDDDDDDDYEDEEDLGS